MASTDVTLALRQGLTREPFAPSLAGQVFRPTSSEEVATFLRIIKPFALSLEARFAIQDGGAQVPPDNEEFDEDVIILDLSSLKGIELHADGSVSIAAGERWTSVYEKLGEEGRSVVGARNGEKGIGALALQGGLSFFSSSRGFVSDNVFNYQVVLASGDIVDAGADVNSDLWRSLKGGANNFGIVTRYDMVTFPQGPLWGGFVYYDPPNFSSQIASMVEELKRSDASNRTHFIVASAYIAQLDQIVCINRVYHTDGDEQAPELKPFTMVLPQVDGFGSLGLLSVKEAAADRSAGAKRRAHMDTTVKADIGILEKAVVIFKRAVEHIKTHKDSSLVASIIFEPLPVTLLRGSAFGNKNLFGLDPSGSPLVSVSFVINWENQSDDVEILGTFRNALDEIKREATSRGLAAVFELDEHSLPLPRSHRFVWC